MGAAPPFLNATRVHNPDNPAARLGTTPAAPYVGTVMSSHTPHNPAADEADEAPKLQIKLPQLIGAACASVLTAVLGSRLGIAGTIIGAAVSSVVFSLFSPFVSFSIERSHHHLKARRQRTHDVASDAAADDSAVGEAPATDPGAPAASQRRTGSHAITRRVGVGLATLGTLLGAVATFLLSMGILTVAETTTGRSVDGKYGTTVSGVVKPDATKTPDAPASAPADDDATPAPAGTQTPVAPVPASTTPEAPLASPEPTRTPAPVETPVEPTTQPSATPTPAQTTDAAPASPTPTPSVTATVRAASTPQPTASATPRS